MKKILFTLLCLGLSQTGKSQDIVGPAGSGSFGSTIKVLTNGNYVIADIAYDDGALTDVGAVYLYDGSTHALISTLKGSTINDKVGSGIYPLSNGNFLVYSYGWDNGSATDVGAVTWVNGVTGLSGVVSPTNSLVGSTTNDYIGGSGIMLLSNGNYLVKSGQWDNGSAVDAGAVTWGNGTMGVSGIISASNSLVGSSASDAVGAGGITILPINGNYVTYAPMWNNGAGAVTWGSATSGVSGVINSANSLIGGPNDYVGNYGITALPSGNYVIRSVNWNGTRGAATWANGTTGIAGTISAANSLVGTTIYDRVGENGISILTNGNYIVLSSDNWDNGSAVNAGAVTWGDGANGTVGVISAANSIVGSTSNDNVGNKGILALTNGNYVVRSINWDNSFITNAGAVTWGNGTTGTSGVVSTANSLVGETDYDRVGDNPCVALTNGNYVIGTVLWDNGVSTDVGAVTWGDGTNGTVGTITVVNSIVGSTSNDKVGNSLIALPNGNYVTYAFYWDNGSTTDVGAVTWGNGYVGTSGEVSVTNSLIGSTANDQIGFNSVLALTNGNYVVLSSYYDNGAIVDAGAATWGNGSTGTAGLVSSANSLVGSVNFDKVAGTGGIALSNGNYLVKSHQWHSGAAANAGALTWGNGTTGISGPITAANSLLGSSANDFVGAAVTILSNGNYVAQTNSWDNGAANVGAVTWGNAATGVTGVISSANSLIGSLPNDNVGGNIFALNNGNYVVTSNNWDKGSTINTGAITWANGSTGITGIVSVSNSLVGSKANDIVGNVGITNLSNGDYIVKSAKVDNTPIVDARASTYAPGGKPLVGTINSCNSVTGTLTDDISVYDVYNAVYDYVLVGRTISNKVTILYSSPMFVKGDSVKIASGDVTPAFADSTDLDSLPINTSVVATYTIENKQMASMTVSAIDITGANASMFILGGLTLPATIPAMGSQTFTITFTPTSAGTQHANIAVTATGSCTLNHTFDIQGTGTASASLAKDEGNSTTNDYGNAIAKDGLGNYYLGGSKGTDGFITKYDGNGNMIWTKNYGSVVNGIVINSSNNAVITGGFAATTTFGGLTCLGSTDAFVAILDNNGDVTSAVKMGSSSIELGNAIAQDVSGNIYVAGEFNKTVDFDPSAGVSNRTSVGARDIFTVKLDANLAFQWVYTAGSTSQDIAYGVTVGDGVYVTGNFVGTVAGMTSAGSYDGFVIKLSTSSGAQMWAQNFGSVGGDEKGSAIALDASNNVYVAGMFQNTVLGVTSSGSNADALIASYDMNGTFRWAKRGGSGYKESANGIAVNGNQVLATGYSRSGVGFTSSGYLNGTSGTNDVFVVKYLTDGTFGCLRLMSGAGDQEGRAVWLGASTFALAGANNGTLGAELDDLTTIPLTTTGLYDAFVMVGQTCTSGSMKMATDNETQVFDNEASTISVYPNPNNGQFTVKGEGNMNIQIFNMNGIKISEQQAENELSIDMKNEVSGIYLVKVLSGTSEKTFRMQVIR